MLRRLHFPSVSLFRGDGSIEMTFEPIAIPPVHAGVTAVCGWVFHDDHLVVVRNAERGWSLPEGTRRAGETFAQTLARIAWDDAGILLGSTRLLGAFHSTAIDADGTSVITICLLAQAREIVPFNDAFEAQDRALVAPDMLAQLVADWNPLMEEVLAYAEAMRRPSPVETARCGKSAVA